MGMTAATVALDLPIQHGAAGFGRRALVAVLVDTEAMAAMALHAMLFRVGKKAARQAGQVLLTVKATLAMVRAAAVRD